MYTDDQLIKQIMLEKHSIEEGVKRFRETESKKSLQDTDNGNRILRRSIAAVVGGIKESYREAEDALINRKGGRSTAWHLMIGLLKPEQAAVITIKKSLEYCTHYTQNKQPTSTTSLAKNIGEAVRQQLMFENWKTNSQISAELEGQQKSFASILIERAKGQVSRPTLAKWKKKCADYENIEWSPSDTIQLGMKLIDIVISTCPDTFTMKTKLIRNKQQRIFNLTDEAWDDIARSNDELELMKPFLLPTLITPKDWSYENGKLTGGYHHIEQPLFTSSRHKHTAADKNAASPDFLASINTIQKTGWKINTWVLSVLEMVSGTGKELGGVPQPCELKIDLMPSEEYNKLSDDERKAYHKKRQLVLEEQASMRGKHSAYIRKLKIAHKMSAHEEFFFPYFADFRGRLYPMAQELNPQGDHVARGLLQFSKGKTVGDRGLYWLKISLANTFGKDKDSFEDRVAWADDVLEDGTLELTVKAPLDNTLWSEADEPMTFLAVARELVEAYKLDNPADFVSYLPVAMDGVCNGMQLLSLLGKDKVGAKKTNCRAIDERFDLYTEVAATVVDICKRDKDSDPVAKEWYNKLNNKPSKARKVVKRAVMTTPYSVTSRGIQEQLINDRHCHDMESSRMTAAGYMRDCIQEAMSSVNGKAVEIMSYLQGVAEAGAENNVPMSWTTPMGLKVTQSYYGMNRTRIKTVIGEVVLWNEDKELGLDVSKNKLAASPNVIHSLDAAMLQLTALKMAELHNVSDFAFIHDSYGTHAADIDILHRTLRDSAFDIFSDDFLADFHRDMSEQLEGVELPEIPQAGDYDITEILTARYFFS